MNKVKRFKPAVCCRTELLSVEECINQLFEAGCIETGEFVLASGIVSPLYVDFRRAISYPELFDQLVTMLSNRADTILCNTVCGVPLASLPFAAGMALRAQRPMIMIRNEKKDHGKGRLIEGVYHIGDHALVIEDLITSGGSTLKTIELLRSEGLIVTDALVILDREQGGKQRIEREGVRVHALCTLSDVLSVLYDNGKIDESTRAKIIDYINEYQFN